MSTLELRDEASVSLARQETRRLCDTVGLEKTQCEQAVLIASELGHNGLRHGRLADLSLRTCERDGVAGIELVAWDQGDGLADADAFSVGVSGAGSLGVGLSSVRSLSHELDVVNRRGEGLEIRARVFVDSAGPRRREVAAWGRPHPHESVSGDQMWWTQRDGGVLIALIDGLGHGLDAHHAAELAVAALKRAPDTTDLPRLLGLVDQAVRSSRGVAATLVHQVGSTLRWAGVGNVAVRVASGHEVRRLDPQPGVLGARRRCAPSVRLFEESVSPTEVVLMHTDGLQDRFHPRDHPGALGRPPLSLAAWLVDRLARPTDDTLVAVLR